MPQMTGSVPRVPAAAGMAAFPPRRSSVATRPKRRQRIRRALLLLSFLLFPITINYFSPYIIVDGQHKASLAAASLPLR